MIRVMRMYKTFLFDGEANDFCRHFTDDQGNSYYTGFIYGCMSVAMLYDLGIEDYFDNEVLQKDIFLPKKEYLGKVYDDTLGNDKCLLGIMPPYMAASPSQIWIPMPDGYDMTKDAKNVLELRR